MAIATPIRLGLSWAPETKSPSVLSPWGGDSLIFRNGILKAPQLPPSPWFTPNFHINPIEAMKLSNNSLTSKEVKKLDFFGVSFHLEDGGREIFEASNVKTKKTPHSAAKKKEISKWFNSWPFFIPYIVGSHQQPFKRSINHPQKEHKALPGHWT